MHHLVFIKDLVANTITVIRQSRSSLRTEGIVGVYVFSFLKEDKEQFINIYKVSRHLIGKGQEDENN